MATANIEISDELYAFVKSFLNSTEEALKLLEKCSKFSDFTSKFFEVVPYVGKALGSIVSLASKEIWQKRYHHKVSTIQTNSSQKFGDLFRTIFVSAAVEIYLTFEFQFKVVYLNVDGIKNKPQGLKILANYAGKRCFKQLLYTGKPENLHRILIPSVGDKCGYEEFEDEPKKSWKNLIKIAETTIAQAKSMAKHVLTDKLTFEFNDSLGNKIFEEISAFQFFDNCIPSFHPEIPLIKQKLEEKKHIWASESIVVDKMKIKGIKSHKYYLLRRPFKLETEKIKPDNLKILDGASVVPREIIPESFDYTVTDFSHLVVEILRKIEHDQSSQTNSDLFIRLNKMEKQLDVLDNGTGPQRTPESNRKQVKAKLPSRVWFQVQDPPESFVGRKEALRIIKQNISKQKEPGHRLTIISQTNIISGLGGVGKTTIAKQYIHKFAQKNHGCNVVFIHAQTHDSLNESFCNLALHLKLVEDPKCFNWEMVKFELYSRICDRKCIMFFDNAESFQNEYNANGIDKFLPSLPPELTKNLSILVTTRNREPASWGNRSPILLDIFTESESIEFVKKELGDYEENEQDIKKLIELCDNLPLALELTVAFIRQNKVDFMKPGYTIAKFLSEDKRKSWISSDPDNILYTTWNLSLKNICKLPNGDLALLILKFMAFSHQPDLISFDFLKSFFSKTESQDYLSKALKLLVKYSLISVRDSGTSYSIHRMVQRVTQERMVGQISECLNFFVSLASIMNTHRHRQDLSLHFIQEWSLIFSWVSSNWKNEDAWSLSKEFVKTIMGKKSFDSDSDSDFDRITSKVYAITSKYLGVHVSIEELFQVSNASNAMKKRLIFLVLKSWLDFLQKAETLNLPLEIVKKAEVHFTKTDNDSSEAFDETKVFAFVFIGNVKDASECSARFINLGNNYMPQEFFNCDWEDKDSQVGFLLLPSKYYMMFDFLLESIFGSSLKPSWKNASKMYYFIGANILAEIVCCANIQNAVDTIQCFISFIDKRRSFASLKRISTEKVDNIARLSWST